MLPEEAFGTTPFPTDWVDTAESQRLLDYQRRDLGDYIQEMVTLLGYLLNQTEFLPSFFEGTNGFV